MKRLKAIWNILTCDEFFLASYYNNYSPYFQIMDEVKYIHPKFNQYFADCIRRWIDVRYKELPKFRQ